MNFETDETPEPFGPMKAAMILPHAATALALARAKLKPPVRSVSIWRLFGATALCAGAAMGLAAAIIVGPPAANPQLRADVNPASR